MIKRVVSGGQYGIDLIGLVEALAAGIPTGGWAPKGWLTESGPNPELGTKYGLKETGSLSYTTRTLMNVRDSDGTVLFGDMTSVGSAKTILYCDRTGKPWITNPTPERLAEWIRRYRIQELNVAGNRASKLSNESKGLCTNTLRTVFTNNI